MRATITETYSYFFTIIREIVTLGRYPFLNIDLVIHRFHTNMFSLLIKLVALTLPFLGIRCL
jgi:hypothetical protein